MANLPQISIDIDWENNMCFGCGQNNPIGLKLDFQWDGKTASVEFTPTEFYQGWSGLVHGGILICLLDEAMGWAALFEGLYCITAEMQARLRRPVSIGETLIITSSITKRNRKLVKAKASISLKDGTLIAEGTATQFVISTKTGGESNAQK